MKKIVCAIFSVLLLSACTVPVTVMENPQTGETARCATMPEFFSRGTTGYNTGTKDESSCVSDHMAQGFRVKRRDQPDW